MIILLSKWLNNSIWPTNGNLIGITTADQCWTGSNGNESELRVPQSSGLEPHYQMQFSVYSRTLFFYLSTEKQSAYSTAPANWAESIKVICILCRLYNKIEYIWLGLYFEKFPQYYLKLFPLVNKVKWFQILRCITNNSIKHQSFIYTQLKEKTVIFQTIQFS